MPTLFSSGGGGFDYVQSAQPANPQLGETWFDVDGGSDGNGEAKVYDGDQWQPTGYTAHGDLTGVTRDAHHPPVEVSGPLTQPADQSLGLSVGDGLANSAGTLVAALGAGLTIDADGSIQIPANGVAQSMLGFDTATQSELDSAESALSTDITAVGNDLDAHAGSTGGVHGVASGDTVAGQDDVDAVTSALSDHEGDTTNPHNVTDDQTGAAAALSDHAATSDAHIQQYPYHLSFTPSSPDSSYRVDETLNLNNGLVHAFKLVNTANNYDTTGTRLTVVYNDGSTESVTIQFSASGSTTKSMLGVGPEFTGFTDGKRADKLQLSSKNQYNTYNHEWYIMATEEAA